jgi:serine/threonine-protein phosphatase 2A regulatory subunit A
MPPFDLFVAQLSSDSTEARVDAMKKLSIVGDAMGTKETIEKLIPYLNETIAKTEDSDDDDEILLLLAGQLAELVPGLVPGYEAMPLIPTLERLCCIDETVVRDKAVETFNKIVPLLLPGGRYDEGMPFGLLRTTAQRLAGTEWFTAKVSAAGVLPTMYAFWNAHGPRGAASDEARREFRVLFKDLSEDDTPMVRRSAAKNLGRFVEAVAGLTQTADEMVSSGVAQPAIADENKRLVAYEVVPIFQALSADEQDSVRLLAVGCAGSVGCGLAREPGVTADVVLPVVRGGCADLSWRVRHNLSKVFATVTGSLGFVGPKHSARQTELFKLFAGLLQDNEAEVRAAAVENIARMAQLGGAELFQAHIAPLLPALADDLVMEVRSKLAQTLMDCCDPSICTALSDEIILQEFRPLLENFLNDEFAEVQLHILSKLSRVSHLLGQMDVVVSSILQMARAQNWRVRDAVGRLLPFLAEARGVSFFEDHLLEPWLKIMSDQVADVRAACIAGMPKLLSVCGSEWIMQEILPHYTRMYDESHSYLTRITVLRSFAALSEQDGENALNISDALMEQIVAIMLRGLADSVPNVRLIAARGLGLVTISGQCDSGVMNAKIVPALSELVTQEQDQDCRYQCQLALEAKV